MKAHESNFVERFRIHLGLFGALIAGALLVGGAATSDAQAAAGKEVRVMTRNLYLGSDLDPGLDADNLPELSVGAGQIFQNVEVTDFPQRAKWLAKEIRSQNPDLVGLQEVALWRTLTPPVIYSPAFCKDVSATFCPKAATVRFDFLALLLAALNKGKPKSQKYSAAVVKNEFDFETPADTDGNPSTCYQGNWTSGPSGNGNGCSSFPGADLTGRLTMRDVILVKAGVKVSQKKSGTFGDRNGNGEAWDEGDVAENIFTPLLAGGVAVPVNRGWTALTASVRKSKPFRFINTHLEAFGNPEEAKCNQAKELWDRVIEPSSLPVVLVGDLNSDDDTVNAVPTQGQIDQWGPSNGLGWDTCAYNHLKGQGMKSMTSINAVNAVGGGSCCLNSVLLDKNTNYAADLDHQVDHIMARGSKITRVRSTRLTGTKPYSNTGGPYWGSDHAGVAQALKIK